MNLMTKDLLINFLIILFPIFLLQMSYLVKYVYRLDALKGSFPIDFPYSFTCSMHVISRCYRKGFCLGFRWIPFLLGGLYGGYRLGIILIDITLVIRYLSG